MRLSARALGQAPGFADLAIAATATHHGLTQLTRNMKHFDGLGVVVIDPFQALPPINLARRSQRGAVHVQPAPKH
ncbi:MAG: hypothetical protein NW215_14730 [Hyphomicrobiales bacterium]|nr:hypothetical protein [Hyphomicrobiales bacterium]